MNEDLHGFLKGSQINGLTSGEFSGFSVSLSSNGETVATTAFRFDGGVGTNSGTTRIYELTTVTTSTLIPNTYTGPQINAIDFDTNGQSIENITSMDVSGNHLYVVGNTGIEKLDVSANIVTFPSANTTYHRTASSSGVGPGINQLQYNNIRSFNDKSVLAVGNNLLSVSTDGTNWTDVSINMINNIGDVTLNQSFILDTSNAIAVGNKGTFLYSRNWPDVNSWQRFLLAL